MTTMMSELDYTKYYRDDYKSLLGRKIVDVRAMTKVEMAQFGWELREPGAVFFFDDGSWFVPMRDDEGNAPGALAYEGRI